MAPTELPTSEVLNRAADRIQRDGWWFQGWDGTDSRGGQPHCAANAVWTMPDVPESVRLACLDALSQHVGGSGNAGAIWDWNDQPERTEAEVIEALRACALTAAAREDATLLADMGRA